MASKEDQQMPKLLTLLVVEARLLLIPYRSKRISSRGLNYKIESDLTSIEIDKDRSLNLMDTQRIEEHTWLKFAAGVSWTPKRVDVNGRMGRRAVCAVAEDRFHYRIYDLDSRDRAVPSQNAMSETSD